MFAQALQQGNNDGARIYASNAIRKKSEALNLLRLSSRIDAVASRVETAVTMRQVTGNMTSVVKGMDRAMDSMNLERVRRTSPQRFSLTWIPRSQWSWTSSSLNSRIWTSKRRTWRTPCHPRLRFPHHKTRSTSSCDRQQKRRTSSSSTTYRRKPSIPSQKLPRLKLVKRITSWLSVCVL